MNWFLLALIGPFLWAISNHIDKFLLEKYFKNKGVGSLMMYSSLIGIVIAPVFFIIRPDVLNIGFSNMLIMFALGISSFVFIWLYMKAMQNDEASIVVPFFQLIPVFAYIIGYFILGEVLTTTQVIAMFLIIFGASLLSVEIGEDNRFRIRKQTLFLMLIACLISAIEQVAFKYVILQEDFWVSSFWTYVGLVSVGLFMFITIKEYRDDFMYSLKNNSRAILSLNLSNEILTIVGNVTATFAYLLAPVTLVLLVGSYQPIFVFIFGVLLTLFFPKISVEKIKLKHFMQKFVAIAVMAVGTYFLFV